MPNHCENELKVKGPQDELERFKLFAKGIYPFGDDKEEILCCNNFIPAPKEAIHDYSNVGYDWCIRNWGTKWGCYDIELLEYKDLLGYKFLTAWAPAKPVIEKMGEMFPLLKFELKYWERGMGFKGVLKIKNGEVVFDEEKDYAGMRGG